MESMTSRERIEAVIHGKKVDRFPVWLKMANGTWQAGQPEPYRSMDSVALLRAAENDVMIGCGPRRQAFGEKKPHVKVTTQRLDRIMRTTVETPDGPLVGEDMFDPYTDSWHPRKFCAADLEDFKKLRWWYTDTSYTVDATIAQEAVEAKKRLVEQDIYTTSGTGPSPFMHLVEHLCGPAAAIYHTFDAPKLVREVVELMHADRMRQLRAILPHTTADTFWISENTSTTLISPDIFKEYCMPCLRDYGNLILEHGIIPVHHMCGTLNALLEMIDTLPALVNEAYTTRPVGNVSLAEGRRRMPSKALLGGTNATLWLAPVEKIVQEVADDLANCPDTRRIFLTSAGVLPPPVSFEKAREVTRRLKALPCR